MKHLMCVIVHKVLKRIENEMFLNYVLQMELMH